jgi:hypothetical protein
MCNFRIGQEVVCVDAKGTTTVDGTITSGLKEGKTYPVLSLFSSPCCGVVTVDVGIKRLSETSPFAYCDCGARVPAHGAIWDFKHTRFAPLQTDSEEADMKAALEEVFERELFQ